jgi:hypothetical protein
MQSIISETKKVFDVELSSKEKKYQYDLRPIFNLPPVNMIVF